MAINDLEVNNTADNRFLKFTNLCFIEDICKIISDMHLVRNVTRYFTIFSQKMKKLARLLKLLSNFIYAHS